METIVWNIPKSAFCVRPELLEKIIFKNKEGEKEIGIFVHWVSTGLLHTLSH